MERNGLKVLVVVLAAVAVAGPSWVAGAAPVKTVAAPPSDIVAGTVRLPAPGEVGIRSHSAMVPVRLSPGADGSWSWEGEIAVDDPDAVSMMVLAPEQAGWHVTVAEPGRRPVRLEDLSWRHDVRHEQAWLGAGDAAVPGELWRIEHPVTGTWTVEIEGTPGTAGDAGPDGYVLVSSRSPYRVYSNLTTYHLVPGESVGLATRAYDVRSPRTDGTPEALEGVVRSASVRIGLPDGSELELPMADDGLHADGAAGDGVWGALFVAEEVGEYTAQVVVRGETPEGRPFLRTTEHVFPIVERTAVLTGRADAVSRRDGLELRIGTRDAAPRRVLVSAELWGEGSDGSAVPVVWTGGIVESAESVVLRVDPRWLARAGVSGGLELRNVTIRDLDTFVPVSFEPRMTAEVHGELMIPKTVSGAITEEMLMGPRPENPPIAREKAAGGKLLLVHGYCSGGVWPTGDFSNYAVFHDYHKNRTHDEFARLIRDFGAQFPSFGVVAHSQGGCASLHLYTYYWSGLDYSSGSRLIQSVGTPYQGTSLAGNLALLGQIFGVGCGSNWDLTYDGSRLWLSGIPSWARNRVYYATASFEDKWWRYDYCNMASDLVLDDPDDGTVERWAGQLSGAHNMGHKEGWCHTANMRDPAETTDHSRNYWMNVSANR